MKYLCNFFIHPLYVNNNVIDTKSTNTFYISFFSIMQKTIIFVVALLLKIKKSYTNIN